MNKNILMAVGVVFILIGLLGFFSDPILGIFEVDFLHNIIHILSGIVALVAASMGEASTKMFGKVFGVVYLIVALVGFVQGSSVLGLISVNMADNLLHIVLAALFLWIGFGGSKTAAPAANPGTPR